MQTRIFRNTLAIAATAAALFAAPGLATTQTVTPSHMTATTESREVPFSEMRFGHSGYAASGPVAQGDTTTPDIRVYDGYGSVQAGPHGTLMKWPHGFRSVLHSHTGDYYGVVISGVMTNYRPGGREAAVQLTPGSYWFQRGGEPHVTECLSEDCTAFLVQDVPFDAQILDSDYEIGGE